MPHIHEKIDFTASVFIVHNERVLIRKHEKYGVWYAPGGHIELDEDPNEAAIREAKEEAGLNVTLINPNPVFGAREQGSTELVPPFYMNRHNITETHEHVDLIFIGTSTTDVLKPHEEEKNTEMYWMSADEIKNHSDMEPNIKQYALKALEVVSKLTKN